MYEKGDVGIWDAAVKIPICFTLSPSFAFQDIRLGRSIPHPFPPQALPLLVLSLQLCPSLHHPDASHHVSIRPAANCSMTYVICELCRVYGWYGKEFPGCTSHVAERRHCWQAYASSTCATDKRPCWLGFLRVLLASGMLLLQHYLVRLGLDRCSTASGKDARKTACTVV